nr:reverse transcriptase domain-containing protein [Tanacetum cinerariifolium]
HGDVCLSWGRWGEFVGGRGSGGDGLESGGREVVVLGGKNGETSSFAVLAIAVTTSLSTTFAQTDPVSLVLSTEVPPSPKIIFETVELDTTPEHALAPGFTFLLAVASFFTGSRKLFCQWELYNWQWECLVHFIPNIKRASKYGGKLGPKWEGPYEVTETLGKGAYMLRDRTWNVLPRT